MPTAAIILSLLVPDQPFTPNVDMRGHATLLDLTLYGASLADSALHGASLSDSGLHHATPLDS